MVDARVEIHQTTPTMKSSKSIRKHSRSSLPPTRSFSAFLKNAVTLKGYSVLGTQLTLSSGVVERAAAPNATEAFVDPAGLHHIHSGPAGAGGSGSGASRVLVGPLICVLTCTQCYMQYFEIARDRVAGMGVYSGSNAFLCWFYDICRMPMVQRRKPRLATCLVPAI